MKIYAFLTFSIISSSLCLAETHFDNNMTNDILYKGNKTICVFKGDPKIKYERIREFKAGKGSYGSLNAVLPKFLNYADRLGGNTVINYSASQKFGFWPWRIVRPVAQGVAVKWASKTNSGCIDAGGEIFSLISKGVISKETSNIKPSKTTHEQEISPEKDIYSELEKLDSLRKKGILTEDEFNTQKKKILSR